MNDLLDFIFYFLILSIAGLLCSFLCFLASNKNEIWEKILEKGDKDD